MGQGEALGEAGSMYAMARGGRALMESTGVAKPMTFKEGLQNLKSEVSSVRSTVSNFFKQGAGVSEETLISNSSRITTSVSKGNGELLKLASLDEAEMPSGLGRQYYTSDLTHVTGKAAIARNAAIQAAIKEDLPNLKLTYIPEYSPFIRTGIAKRSVGTQIGKNRFVSRETLVDTIVHEELHHRWWNKGIESPHHSTEYVPNELFYNVLERHKRMRERND